MSHKDRINTPCCVALLHKPDQDTPVGLSYCPQSHRFFIQIDKHKTGETRVKHKVKPIYSAKDLFRGIAAPPIRSGQIFQDKMTIHAKRTIKLASRVFQWLVDSGLTQKTYASFITLTYGLHYPEDHLSKKHLDNFIKRIRRKYPLFQFIWVIEKQKRGAPHFHILTPNYIDKRIINKAWNGIVQKWQRSQIENGCKQQDVYPHVGKVYEAGKYMTKYMQKAGENIGGNMYGIDFMTRQLCKPETITLEGKVDLDLISQELTSTIAKKDSAVFNGSDFYGNHQAWISQINGCALKEFLEYNINELNLVKHEQHSKGKKRISV